jgi:hypothetical protein
MIKRLGFFLACLLLATPAWADDYAEPTLENMVKALARFGAIDIKDDLMIDDYAIISACDLYTQFYDNDFKWSEVRTAIRESVNANIASYPTSFYYDATVQLARYDFKSSLFRFTERSTVTGVNSFVFTFSGGDGAYCDGHTVKYLPTNYTLVAAEPITISGLPFAENDANDLLSRMKEDGNNNRVIYARFNLRIAYIEPLRKSHLGAGKPQFVQNSMARTNRTMRIDVRLDSVDFFEDDDRTRLIYSYRL